MRALEPTAGDGLGACGVPTDLDVVEGVGELLPCWEARHEGGMMSRTQLSQDEGLGTGVAGGSEFVPTAAERTPGAAEVTVIRTVSVGGQGHSLAHAGGGQ